MKTCKAQNVRVSFAGAAIGAGFEQEIRRPTQEMIAARPEPWPGLPLYKLPRGTESRGVWCRAEANWMGVDWIARDDHEMWDVYSGCNRTRELGPGDYLWPGEPGCPRVPDDLLPDRGSRVEPGSIDVWRAVGDGGLWNYMTADRIYLRADANSGPSLIVPPDHVDRVRASIDAKVRLGGLASGIVERALAEIETRNARLISDLLPSAPASGAQHTVEAIKRLNGYVSPPDDHVEPGPIYITPAGDLVSNKCPRDGCNGGSHKRLEAANPCPECGYPALRPAVVEHGPPRGPRFVPGEARYTISDLSVMRDKIDEIGEDLGTLGDAEAAPYVRAVRSSIALLSEYLRSRCEKPEV